ncbi:MAG: MOSC domain-containing protein [Betaproteobacteria bacterium]
MKSLPDLFGQFPQPGRVEWIGVRPQRESRVVSVPEVRALQDVGLQGDHYAGGAGGKRHLTLIQHEHLAVVGRLLALRDKTPVAVAVDPGLVRRNIVISGLNLLALKNQRFRLGEAVLEFTGPCQPCSAMEETLGRGGYNAMRGHGGICARIIEGGLIRVGDELVTLVAE